MKIEKFFNSFDNFFIGKMQNEGVTLLRITLAIVYIWFGVLKIMGVSPVVALIESTYPTFPEPMFLIVLGVWEVAVGVGLLHKYFLRLTLALLWLQMAGVFFGFLLDPGLYFIHGNPFLLSADGEFVIKNLVLVAASIVIGGYEVKRKK